MKENLYIKLRKQGAVKAAAIVILGYGFVVNGVCEGNRRLNNWIKNLNFID